jgi:hypothetical protein
MTDIAKWATANASLLVVLSLALTTLVIVVLGLIGSLWIVPKLKDLDDLKATLNKPAISAPHLAMSFLARIDAHSPSAVLHFSLC